MDSDLESSKMWKEYTCLSTMALIHCSREENKKSNWFSLKKVNHLNGCWIYVFTQSIFNLVNKRIMICVVCPIEIQFFCCDFYSIRGKK